MIEPLLAAAGIAEASADGIFPPALFFGILVVMLLYSIICPAYWCFVKRPSALALLLTAFPILFCLLSIISVNVRNHLFR